MSNPTYRLLEGFSEVAKFNNTGVTYCENGDFDQGIANFNYAIRLNPNLVEPYLNRSFAFDCVGLNLSSLLDLAIIDDLGAV